MRSDAVKAMHCADAKNMPWACVQIERDQGRVDRRPGGTCLPTSGRAEGKALSETGSLRCNGAIRVRVHRKKMRG